MKRGLPSPVPPHLQPIENADDFSFFFCFLCVCVFDCRDIVWSTISSRISWMVILCMHYRSKPKVQHNGTKIIDWSPVQIAVVVLVNKKKKKSIGIAENLTTRLGRLRFTAPPPHYNLVYIYIFDMIVIRKCVSL